jgi:hypothetical protein
MVRQALTEINASASDQQILDKVSELYPEQLYERPLKDPTAQVRAALQYCSSDFPNRHKGPDLFHHVSENRWVIRPKPEPFALDFLGTDIRSIDDEAEHTPADPRAAQDFDSRIRELPQGVQQIVMSMSKLKGQEGSPKRIYEKLIELYPHLSSEENLRAAVRIRLQEWSSDSTAWKESRPWKQKHDLFEQVQRGLWRLRNFNTPNQGRAGQQPKDDGYAADDYDPGLRADELDEVLAFVARRLGQADFRRDLLRNYHNKCRNFGANSTIH